METCFFSNLSKRFFQNFSFFEWDTPVLQNNAAFFAYF